MPSRNWHTPSKLVVTEALSWPTPTMCDAAVASPLNERGSKSIQMSRSSDPSLVAKKLPFVLPTSQIDEPLMLDCVVAVSSSSLMVVAGMRPRRLIREPRILLVHPLNVLAQLCNLTLKLSYPVPEH